MKASTKTKQPKWMTESKWSIEIANQLDDGGYIYPKPDKEGINDIAGIISRSPAIKELVEATEEICAYVRRIDPLYVVKHSEKAGQITPQEKRIISALQPFKDFTGGG